MHTTMADQLDILQKLQAIDAERYRLRREQERKPLELAHVQQELAQHQAEANRLEARVKTLQLQHKEKDIELSSREAHVKKLQLQLFQVKTNKEYAAMQSEIANAKADVSVLEEDIIHLLDAIDRAKQDQQRQAATVQEHETLVRREEARIQQELAQIEHQSAAYEQQRQVVLPSVQPEALAVYERVLANREGIALAPLVGDSCGGCHMMQPPQVVNQVQLKAALVTCESCNRILYLDDPTP